MQKIVLLLFGMVLYSGIAAQVENTTAARYTKILPADSLLKITPTVKAQLTTLLNQQKQQPAKYNTLRLVVTAADSNKINPPSRWLAAKQQQHLYQVNLAALVSKYIGETEKNLDRVFSQAEQKNCVLIFNEADALFAQRSNDAGSTNSISYFLQKSGSYKGTVIITCNGNDCTTKLVKQHFITVAGL